MSFLVVSFVDSLFRCVYGPRRSPLFLLFRQQPTRCFATMCLVQRLLEKRHPSDVLEPLSYPAEMPQRTT